LKGTLKQEAGNTYWLSLGSNIGKPVENLLQGINYLLGQGFSFVDCSGMYITEPVGYTDQPDFYNLVLKLRSRMEPLEALAVCQAAEAHLKRVRDVRWGPRTLDVDILLIDDLEIDLPQLTVPHPRMKERAFVLGPLAEMDPYVMEKWSFPHLQEGIGLHLTANDVKMLLQQNR